MGMPEVTVQAQWEPSPSVIQRGAAAAVVPILG
jgi:hypothetical protein